MKEHHDDILKDLFAPEMTDDERDSIHELIVEIDRGMDSVDFTIDLIDDLTNTLEPTKWQVWCDGNDLRLVDPDTGVPGDEYALVHEFTALDSNQADDMYDMYRAGWALKFGFGHTVEKLFDGPSEPTGSIDEDGIVRDAHGEEIGRKG